MVWSAADENLNRDSTIKATVNHTHHSVFWASHCVMGIPHIRRQMANVILHAKTKLYNICIYSASIHKTHKICSFKIKFTPLGD